MISLAEQGFNPGTIVCFTGYSDENVEPLLNPGQLVRIDSLTADGGLTVFPVDGGSGDTVFPEEVQLIEDDAEFTEDEQSVEEVVEAVEALMEESEPDISEALTAENRKALESVVVEEPAPAEEKATIKPRGKAKKDLMGSVLVITDENQGGEVVTIEDSAIVAKTLRDQDALEAAKSLSQRSKETYYALGGVLAHIYHEKSYVRAGYEGDNAFGRYVETELDESYRKAMHLIDIYVTFRRLGADETRLVNIGWSKAKELTRYITGENCEQLLKMAESLTRDELVSQLRAMKSLPTRGGDRPPLQRIAFVPDPDQNTIIQRALEMAKAESNLPSDTMALEAVCAEFLIMNAGMDVGIEVEISRIERKYGVKVQVV